MWCGCVSEDLHNRATLRDGCAATWCGFVTRWAYTTHLRQLLRGDFSEIAAAKTSHAPQLIYRKPAL